MLTLKSKQILAYRNFGISFFVKCSFSLSLSLLASLIGEFSWEEMIGVELLDRVSDSSLLRLLSVLLAESGELFSP